MTDTTDTPADRWRLRTIRFNQELLGFSITELIENRDRSHYGQLIRNRTDLRWSPHNSDTPEQNRPDNPAGRPGQRWRTSRGLASNRRRKAELKALDELKPSSIATSAMLQSR